MKLLHTADWHIGQTFFEYDRNMEHLYFLNWLKEQIHSLGTDALLIAGDVFDSPNPSAESQKIFYRFLKEATTENPGLQIVIIAGNHDSAARLEAPNPLLEEMNVTIRGLVKRTEDGNIDYNHFIVPLFKEGEIAAYCLAVPYLRQGDYPEADNYAEGVRSVYETLYNKVQQYGKPVIAMGHLQATGSEISENDRAERTIIGGLECISPDSFHKGIAYTALGHLHRSQQVSKRENIRYSGAPLPMSFAEKNNKQGIVSVELTESGTHIEKILFDTPVKLISIPHSPMVLSEIWEELEKLPSGDLDYDSPFLEIKVLIKEPEPSLRHQIEDALTGKAVRLARIEAVIPSRETENKVITYEELQTINPMDIALDIFQKRFGGETMPDKMKELLLTVIRDIEQ